MEAKNCLNCNAELHGKFCANCGQKSNTHRLTFKHFITHDIVHGIWHFDKGIPFTLKQIFTRPGYAAVDYINGKRKNYYNVFYLLLLLLALTALIYHQFEAWHLLPKDNDTRIFGMKNNQPFFNLGNVDNKFFVFTYIPLISINAYWIFRKLHYNLVEHVIIAAFALLGCVVLNILTPFFDAGEINKYFDISSWNIFSILSSILTLIIIIFPVFVYRQVTKHLYSRIKFSWRIILLYTIFLIEGIIILLIIYIIWRLLNHIPDSSFNFTTG